MLHVPVMYFSFCKQNTVFLLYRYTLSRQTVGFFLSPFIGNNLAHWFLSKNKINSWITWGFVFQRCIRWYGRTNKDEAIRLKLFCLYCIGVCLWILYYNIHYLETCLMYLISKLSSPHLWTDVSTRAGSAWRYSAHVAHDGDKLPTRNQCCPLFSLFQILCLAFGPTVSTCPFLRSVFILVTLL